MANDNNQIDVISLEWTTAPSRDRISATLVCNYLRHQGFRVADASVWDGLQAIYRTKPRLLFITNTVGAWENFELMRYAKRRKLLGASLVSEGNLQGDEVYQSEMIWGWNKEKHLYEDITMQWSEFSRNSTLALHPELQGRIKISGGVGFDNYKIADVSDAKDNLLKKYDKTAYKKVVGVGCWDFGICCPQDTRFKFFESYYDGEQRKRFLEDASAFDDALATLADNNKDILFLLKQHPGAQLGHMASGITQTAKRDNVLIFMNEEPILTCIQASDLWIVYESTTAMEAWLLGKPTCLLNPSGRDFPRDGMNEGSPDCQDHKDLQKILDSLYANRPIQAFAERAETRGRLIKNVIQWNDGLNHVRAGNEIIELLETHPRSEWQNETRQEMARRWKQHAKWLVYPYLRWSGHFRTSDANRNNFSIPALKAYQDAKRREQEAFYRRLGLSLEDLRQVRCL